MSWVLRAARSVAAAFSVAVLIAGFLVVSGVVTRTDEGFAVRTPGAEAAAPQIDTPAEIGPTVTATVAPPVMQAPVDPAPGAFTAIVDRSGPPLQCAIYARQRTGLALTGLAREWWPQAEGRYRRSHTPAVGAVIVMGGTSSGHVAVVTRVINSRQILVDHANWLNTGEIITGALMQDASQANDWSAVRVWHPPTNTLGLTPYPVFGFVHPEPAPT